MQLDICKLNPTYLFLTLRTFPLQCLLKSITLLCASQTKWEEQLFWSQIRVIPRGLRSCLTLPWRWHWCPCQQMVRQSNRFISSLKTKKLLHIWRSMILINLFLWRPGMEGSHVKRSSLPWLVSVCFCWAVRVRSAWSIFPKSLKDFGRLYDRNMISNFTNLSAKVGQLRTVEKRKMNC